MLGFLVGLALAESVERVTANSTLWFHTLMMEENVSYIFNLTTHDLVILDVPEHTWSFKVKMNQIWYDSISPDQRSLLLTGEEAILTRSSALNVFLRYWLLPKGFCGCSLAEFGTSHHLIMRSYVSRPPETTCLFAVPGIKWSKVHVKLTSQAEDTSIQLFRTDQEKSPMQECSAGTQCRWSSGWIFFLRIKSQHESPYSMSLAYDVWNPPRHHRGCWMSPMVTFDQGDLFSWPPVVGKPGSFQCVRKGSVASLWKPILFLSLVICVIAFVKPSWMETLMKQMDMDRYFERFDVLKRAITDEDEEIPPNEEAFPETSEKDSV